MQYNVGDNVVTRFDKRTATIVSIVGEKYKIVFTDDFVRPNDFRYVSDDDLVLDYWFNRKGI